MGAPMQRGYRGYCPPFIWPWVCMFGVLSSIGDWRENQTRVDLAIIHCFGGQTGADRGWAIAPYLKSKKATLRTIILYD